MKTAIDLEAITIDGGKLREAREARNLSVAELAALVTLSREQVKAIEEGGHRPFYTPAHKLLAVRKYANALEIAYEDFSIRNSWCAFHSPDSFLPVSHIIPKFIPGFRVKCVKRRRRLRGNRGGDVKNFSAFRKRNAEDI